MAAGDWCQELITGVSAYLITLNSKGNVILAGQEAGGALVFAEYTPSGQNLWVQELTTDDYYSLEGLATDANDNILIAGSVTDGVSSLIQPLIAKLTPQGELLWLREPGGMFRSGGIAVDANGNAVLAAPAAQLLQYSPSGDVLWSRSLEGRGGVALPTVDAMGNIFVVSSDATSNFVTELSETGDPLADKPLGSLDFSPASTQLAPNGDLILVGFDQPNNQRRLMRYSLTTGVVWSFELTLELYTGDHLALDRTGNIFVIGMANDFGQPYYDTYLAKYDPDGTLLWGKTLGERGDSASRDLVVDADGDVFVAGGSIGGAFLMRVSGS